jgi:hypothetical protein
MEELEGKKSRFAGLARFLPFGLGKKSKRQEN